MACCLSGVGPKCFPLSAASLDGRGRCARASGQCLARPRMLAIHQWVMLKFASPAWMMKRRKPSRYISRTAYLDPASAGSYERDRFSSALGRYRWRREMDGGGEIVDMLPPGLSVLDCPCGTGRWWAVLQRRALRIHGVDLSPAMLDVATARIERIGVPVEVSVGDAERLEFDDDSFDAVFSHALTKHLPIPIQHKVLTEFARVSREWVICSFSLLGHITYEFWRRRNLVDSNALLPEQLDDVAAAAGLAEVARSRCTTPIGVEHSVLFRKRR